MKNKTENASIPYPQTYTLVSPGPVRTRIDSKVKQSW
jgi:hypothetical protein